MDARSPVCYLRRTVKDSPRKTVIEVLQAASEYLAANRVDEARAICEWLLARLLKCKRLELPLHHQRVLSEPLLDAMRRGIRRVSGGEPLQYVLGETEFMGHRFKTDRRALIPRPETELLVEAALKSKPLWEEASPLIVDVGTGSGCIAISLALERPHAMYAALDVSEAALALAKENADALGLGGKIAFVNSELPDLAEPQSVNGVITNPPYIPTAEWEKLPVHIREHEPRQALDGGPNGLSVIGVVIQDAAIALKPGGFLIMEIGHNQGPAVRQLMEEAEFTDVEIRRDLAGHDRIAIATLSPA